MIDQFVTAQLAYVLMQTQMIQWLGILLFPLMLFIVKKYIYD